MVFRFYKPGVIYPLDSKLLATADKINRHDLGDLMVLSPISIDLDEEDTVFRGVYLAKKYDCIGIGTYKPVIARKSFGEIETEIYELGYFINKCLEGDIEFLDIIMNDLAVVRSPTSLYHYISEYLMSTKFINDIISRNYISFFDYNKKKYKKKLPPTMYMAKLMKMILLIEQKELLREEETLVAALKLCSASSYEESLDKLAKIYSDGELGISNAINALESLYKERKKYSTLKTIPLNIHKINNKVINIRSIFYNLK